MSRTATKQVKAITSYHTEADIVAHIDAGCDFEAPEFGFTLRRVQGAHTSQHVWARFGPFGYNMGLRNKNEILREIRAQFGRGVHLIQVRN